MDVIGAGFGRTGTLSTKTALERLGFGPCYHMSEVFTHPEHFALWARLADGQRVAWDDLFGEYRASSDFPACLVYRELMDVYPNAKVLLTVRDPERWYASTRETIYTMSMMEDFPFPPDLKRAVNTLVWERLFDGRFEDEDYAIDVFNRWIEEARRTVPAERLLVFDVKEGWEPLCRFLGVPVPEEPFPHVNEGAQMKAMIDAVRRGEPLVPPDEMRTALEHGAAPQV